MSSHRVLADARSRSVYLSVRLTAEQWSAATFASLSVLVLECVCLAVRLGVCLAVRLSAEQCLSPCPS